MSYCVNCGVKLGESEQSCPLCQTKVYHPDAPPKPDAIPPFPPGQSGRRKMKPQYGHLIVTLMTILPVFLSVICDYSINRHMVWSGFVLGGATLLYCCVFVPMFLPKRHFFAYLGLDFLACFFFLFYIEQITGGSWFRSFALPVTLSVFGFLAVVYLFKRLKRRSDLLFCAAIFFLSGLECVFIEVMVNRRFLHSAHLVWSFFPLITFSLLALFLFILYKNKRLRRKFEKFFFI